MPLTQREKLKIIRKTQAKNPTEHSKKFWVEVCRRGLQTLTLFNTETVHFATFPFTHRIKVYI